MKNIFYPANACPCVWYGTGRQQVLWLAAAGHAQEAWYAYKQQRRNFVPLLLPLLLTYMIRQKPLKTIYITDALCRTTGHFHGALFKWQQQVLSEMALYMGGFIFSHEVIGRVNEAAWVYGSGASMKKNLQLLLAQLLGC